MTASRHAAGAAIIVMIAAFAGAREATSNLHAAGIPKLQCPRDDNPAIRTDDSYTQAVLDMGMTRSPTFAALMNDLEQTDIVVIIEPAPKLSLRLTGVLTFMSSTQYCRYVRVRFTTRLGVARAVPVVGHELRHALEVAQHAEVVDSNSLRQLYEWYGRRTGLSDTFESAEAEATGRTILEEMLRPAIADAGR